VKIYRCIVLDPSYKKCVGMIEADDEQDVKEKIISQGFSVLSVKEVSSEVKMTIHGFQPVDEVASRQGSSIGIEPPEITEETARKTLNKHHLILLFLLILLLIGGYCYFVLFPKINQVAPDQVVIQYMELGYQKKWSMQFDLLDKNLKVAATSLEQYGQAMEERWRAYPQEHTPEDNDESRMILKNGRYQIEPILVTDLEAQFKVVLNYPLETKELIVGLAHNKSEWNIRYLRDMTKISNYIERLAEGVRSEIEEKMLGDLKRFDGFSEEDIREMVTKAKIDRLKKMRQDEIERREKVQKRKLAKEKNDEVIVTSSEVIKNQLKESDLVQEKLEQTIKMIEEIEK
jgi:hypothetical protein